MDKQELLDTIQRESTAWERFLDEVGEPTMEQPGATGDWSFKDVVAHISAWRARTLQRLEAARNDQTPSAQFWPAGWDEENDADTEKINHWIYEENCDRSLSEVLNESRQQFRRMRELVRSLPEDKLLEPDRFDWMEGKPLAALVSFDHFHEEHEPALRQWLANQSE
jgi:hypothetical protein